MPIDIVDQRGLKCGVADAEFLVGAGGARCSFVDDRNLT
jgi:hypothetical protein